MRGSATPSCEAKTTVAGEDVLTEPPGALSECVHDPVIVELPCVIFRLISTDADALPLFTSVSEQAHVILEADPAELVLNSAGFFDRIELEDAGRVRASMRNAFICAGHWREQFRLRLGNGVHWFEVNARVRATPDRCSVADGFVSDITDRDLLQRDAQLIRDTDSFVFDTAPQPIVIADEAGNARAINRAFINTFGYRIEEIPDRETRMRKLVPDETYRARLTQQRLDGTKRFVTSGMQPEPIVARVKCKDGTERTVELRTTLGARGSITILTDVGEALRAEGKHRDMVADRDGLRAELGLRSELLPIALLVSDPTDALITRDWNAAATRIFGYSREEMLGTSPYDSIVPPELHNYVRSAIDNIIRAPGSVTSLSRNRTKDGRLISTEWCCATVRDAHGIPSHVISTVQDVTERQLADERRRLWTSVLEQSGEGIMICDPQRRILLVNAAFERLTGFVSEEAIGQTPAILHSGRQDKEFYAALWTKLTTTGQWSGEIWNRRKSGEIYPEWLALSTVRDELGTVSHYVGIFSDMTERNAAEDRVRRVAHYDVLTSLPNRSLLIDRLEQLIKTSCRDASRAAVMFIDLDRFKEVNDSLGLDTGDLLLKTIASRISGALRNSDTVARVGGDEFIILLPHVGSSEEVANIAHKLLDAMRAPLMLQEQQLSISASIGVCTYPNDGTTAVELIRNADAAMHRAKSGGRNAYNFYTHELNERALARLQTESALRLAIERRELLLHYQPQVDLGTGCVVGAEALIRWNRPGVGIAMPGQFIPLAEERGLIVAIGQWVLHEAMRQARVWDAAGLTPIRIAVNVSASEFHHNGFMESITQAIAEGSFDPSRIEIEVTEGVAVRDIAATTSMLTELHGLGFRLSLDDFGTGYSSLNYLRHFPIDKIKIDQSFVAELSDEGAGSLRTVRAIINLAKSYSIKVIAEGVENQSQLAALRVEHCDEIQGYLVSQPLPPEEFERLVRNWKPLK